MRRASCQTLGPMSQRRGSCSEPKPPTRKRSARISVRTITGRTWFTELRRWGRWLLIAGASPIALLLVIACMPVLVWFAAIAKPATPETTSRTFGASSVIAFTLLLLAVAASTAATLVETARTGEFCSKPTRYAGLYCTTYEKTPILLIVSILVFWAVFWLCAAFVTSSIRSFLAESSNGA